MGIFPEGKDGEKFRKDMRMFGVASGFFASAGIGIFCGAEYMMSAPGEGIGWLVGSGLGAMGSLGSLMDLKACFKAASSEKSPPPPSEPPAPSLPG